MEVKRQILASQISVKRTLKNEQGLERELSKFFKRLQKEVLSALYEYWSEYQLLQGQINLMVAPVHEAHREYYEILEKYVRREYKLGVAEAKRNVERLRKKNRVAFKAIQPMPLHGIIRKGDPKNMNDWFATIPKAEKDLLNRTFRASEQTMSRVDNQINKIITDGYRGGKGINDIGAQLNKRFDQLSSWEARRIARTEVNTSHNAATVDTYRDMGVEYTQWIAAHDDRTRDSHAEVDGEIIPMGGKYSNGLEYPGDMSGDISEWINCRCSNAPFVIPYGYMAPSFSPFREEDLIPIETEPLVTEPQVIEPTEDSTYQLNNRENSYSEVKITQEQFEKVIAHQSKRANAKLEFGNSIDNATGELLHNKDIRGKKNTVHIPTHHKPYSVIHNHTNNGGFSGGDAYSHIMGAEQEVCYATTPEGVWIMRDTTQGTFSKKEGFISENTATEIKYRMEGKFRKLSQEVKAKYQSQYDNAKTREERVEIGQKVNNEVFKRYNDWLLDEFAVGKRRDWLIEIEFIPKEKLNNVQF